MAVKRRAAGFLEDKKIQHLEFPRAAAYMETMGFVKPWKTLDNILSYEEGYLQAVERMIVGKLHFLQYESSQEENAGYLLVTGIGPWMGFGAYMRFIEQTLTLGYLYNRTVIYDDRKLSYDFPYAPVTNLSINDVDGILSGSPCFNYLPQREKVACWNYTSRFNHHCRMWQMQHRRRIGFFDVLENLPAKPLYGLGLVMEKFLKLKAEYSAHIEERRRALGGGGPRIGVHIRQGEVMFNPDLRCRRFAADSYIRVVEQVVAATGVKTVFVATDSEAALRQLPKDSGLDFIYDDEERRYDNRIAKMLHKEPSLRKQETLTAIKNIYLLADCDYLVYSDSALARCALGLSYYRNKRLNAVMLEQPGPPESARAKPACLNGVSLENPADGRLVVRIIRREERDSPARRRKSDMNLPATKASWKAAQYRVARFIERGMAVKRRTVGFLEDKKIQHLEFPRAAAYMETMGFVKPWKTLDNILSYEEGCLQEIERMVVGKLHFLQYEFSQKENAKYLLVTGINPGLGFGAYMHIIERTLTLGYLYNRTVIYDDWRLSYDFPYEPVTNLSINDVDGILSGSPCFNYLPQCEKAVCWSYTSRFNRHCRMWQTQHKRRIGFCDVLENLPENHLYDLGLVMGKFLKLKEEYSIHIEERRRALGGESPRIGVHIRQGELRFKSDPRDGQHRCFAADSYIRVVEQVAAATGVKTVFVATDSEAALRQLPKDSGLDFIYDDEERRYDNHLAGMLDKEPSLRKQETLTAIRNIYLLADCDYLVYSNSALTRCALGLSYYRNKRLNAVMLEQPGPPESARAKPACLNGVSLENPADCRLTARIVRREKA